MQNPIINPGQQQLLSVTNGLPQCNGLAFLERTIKLKK